MDGDSFPTQHVAQVSPRLRLGLILLIGCGVLLRVWQFSANSALWLDEIAIARNVVERPAVLLLTSPLDYQQSAPKGFLAAEKFAVAIGGPGELALRAWPLATSIAALFLMSVLAIAVLDGHGAIVAVAGLAFATPLITQAGEVKQYSSDVAVALVLMLLALPRAHRSRRFDVLAGVAGAVAIWFSQPAALVALAMVLVLGQQAWTLRADRQQRLTGAWRAALWSASAAIATLVAIRSMTPATRAYMQQYWGGGFPPPDFVEALRSWWPWPAVYELFGAGAPGFRNTLDYFSPAIYALLSALGLVLLVRRASAGWVVTVPVLVTIAAAAAGQYPFRDRVILFLLPSFFIGLGCAVSALHQRIAHIHSALAVTVTAILLAGLLTPLVRSLPPYTMEDMKPIMAAMQVAHARKDAIYVHANAASAFTYYVPRYGIPPTAFALGGCHFPIVKSS